MTAYALPSGRNISFIPHSVVRQARERSDIAGKPLPGSVRLLATIGAPAAIWAGVLWMVMG